MLLTYAQKRNAKTENECRKGAAVKAGGRRRCLGLLGEVSRLEAPVVHAPFSVKAVNVHAWSITMDDPSTSTSAFNRDRTDRRTSGKKVVITQPKGNHLVLVGLEGQREWTTGLCGCCENLINTLCTYFCLPLVACRLSYRLNECPLLLCCCPDTIIAARTKVRIMGGIKGSILKDACAVWCCCACVMCQLSRELDAMGI
ncbi:placenta-specific gene 8 protein-like [Babylonia areolata]|uniref:placenta-specific gene 8 protein-like n=1 Tax=Babylonia areolata TaxID=304850 RepID=UPI003FD3EA52